MTRPWHHECSEEWLRARRGHLTATEISKLVPELKRMQKKDAVPEQCFGIIGEKTSSSELDTSSVGPAARGHILEPYAIEEFSLASRMKFYHWDDILVYDEDNPLVAFSPDGMNIRQPVTDPSITAQELGDQATAIIEVKCYEAAKHARACACKQKLELPECMQVAVAFKVMPQLKRAWIVFYNPSCLPALKAYLFTRDELWPFIQKAELIEKMYREAADEYMERTKYAGIVCALASQYKEDEIWNQTMGNSLGL